MKIITIIVVLGILAGIGNICFDFYYSLYGWDLVVDIFATVWCILGT